ncbi:MAG: DUF3179 domain-containing protein [Cyclobacteriaceae bacterium]
MRPGHNPLHFTQQTIFFSLVLLLIGCENNDSDAPVPILVGNTNEWLIPSNQVFDGGPGKDGIPALTTPNMINVSEVNYLKDDDLVVGYKFGNDVRAYPHPILDWHEIINDEVNGHPIAIIYCPLTGTATGWERTLKGQVTTFGVSGLLYNTNVIPYDRLTDSNWSQMRLDCVNGELNSTPASVFQVIETTWSTWKAMYPQSKVASTETGFARTYGLYPYGSYRTNNDSFLFPFSPKDERLPNKERVLGVIVDNKAKAYRFTHFENGLDLLLDSFNGKNLIIVGSKPDNFLMAFDVSGSDIASLTFEVEKSSGASIILKDNEGDLWDVFGEAVDGPRKGTKLKSVNSYIGYWFSWGAFYPGIEIF